MNVAAPVFAALALVLAGPVPGVLARSKWPLQAPRAALVLWQSIMIAAVYAPQPAATNMYPSWLTVE